LPLEQRYCQPPGDLGQKLAFIVESGLKTAQGVVLLGGDGVSVTESLLDRVEEALERVPAVLAPAEDGGYILLALTRLDGALFTGIPWGGEKVAEVTRDRLRGLEWPWQEFPGQWDVDREVDWLRFKGLVEKGGKPDKSAP
jgi:uncharacterized protein